MSKALITGSGGLIGSEAARFFASKGFDVFGIDNDMRSYFFGAEASTEPNLRSLEKQLGDSYHHCQVDIRDSDAVERVFKEHVFDLVIHTAAQPSHDWAAREPLTDFSVNATGTLVLLESLRRHCPDAVFIFTSTNKVYGDRPNTLPLIEQETRWELPTDHPFYAGIDESMSIDDSKHSIFGASKVAADIMVQEYGKYFGFKTAVFRGGCLTGPAHAAAELHGFLGYLIKCIASDKRYTVYGHKGKQVRDNIHSHDLVNAFYHFFKAPRPGEVYNIGGSRRSNISVLEAITAIERRLGKEADYAITPESRSGDHIWYVSDVTKFQSHYPEWRYTYGIDTILDEMCAAAKTSQR